MMRRTPRQSPATLRQPSGSSARLSRQKLPLGWYHRLCVRTERAASELDRSKWDPCLAFEFRNLRLSEGRQVAGQEMQKSVFSHFGHSSTIVARARAVRMSLRATPEAQGGRHSARTEGPRRGLSARAKPRCGYRVNIKSNCDRPEALVAMSELINTCTVESGSNMQYRNLHLILLAPARDGV